MAIPIKPAAIPTNDNNLGRSLSIVRNSAVQIGMAATMREATPIGTTSSANAIVPRLVPSMKTPRNMALENCLRFNFSAATPFRSAMKTKSAALAATNRNDIDIKGGMVSIVNAIPM